MSQQYNVISQSNEILNKLMERFFYLSRKRQLSTWYFQRIVGDQQYTSFLKFTLERNSENQDYDQIMAECIAF